MSSPFYIEVVVKKLVFILAVVAFAGAAKALFSSDDADVIDANASDDAEQIIGTGKWLNSKHVSLDDSRRFTAGTYSTTPVFSGYGDEYPLLSFQCRKNKTSFAAIGWKRRIRGTGNYGGEYVRVLTRLDDEKAEAGLMPLSNDGYTVFVAMENPKYFADKWINHKRLAVEIEGDIAVFNLSGMKKAIQPLRDECGW